MVIKSKHTSFLQQLHTTVKQKITVIVARFISNFEAHNFFKVNTETGNSHLFELNHSGCCTNKYIIYYIAHK